CTLTVACEWAGAMTCNLLAEITFTLLPAAVPKVTFFTLVNPLPVTVTVVPPAGVPACGDTDETIGVVTTAVGATVYRALVVAGETPVAVTTRRFTLPDARAATVTLSSSGETTFTNVLVTAPNITFRTRLNPVPTTVTFDLGGPDRGNTDITFGAST